MPEPQVSCQGDGERRDVDSAASEGGGDGGITGQRDRRDAGGESGYGTGRLIRIRFRCCDRRQPESAAEVRQRSERWTGNVLLGVSRAYWSTKWCLPLSLSYCRADTKRPCTRWSVARCGAVVSLYAICALLARVSPYRAPVCILGPWQQQEGFQTPESPVYGCSRAPRSSCRCQFAGEYGMLVVSRSASRADTPGAPQRLSYAHVRPGAPSRYRP
jgi:hypothetical protein